MKKKLEMRTIAGEIRAVEDSELGEGIIEGYLTKWGAVDSYGTTFIRGAFKNTFSTRGNKGTRLFWNHRELAGKILELREDAYGPFFVAQCNLDTEVGKKCFAHVRAEDVNCNSFGFNTIDDKWAGQVRQITEVDMLECGPVIFEANLEAKITNFREAEGNQETEETTEGQETEEKRSEDFDETQVARELNNKGWSLLSSLDWTIDDIFYTSNPTHTPTEVIQLVDTAISKFHLAYMEWVKEYYAYYETRGSKPPCEFRNLLQTIANSLDMDALTRDSTLTSDETDQLKKGCLLPLEARSRLETANEDLFSAHQKTRTSLVETLCDELRSTTMTPGEVERIEALVGLNKKESEVGGAIDFLKEFRSRL